VEDIQVDTNINLPRLERWRMEEKTSLLALRWRRRLGTARVRLHLKRIGSQVGCFARVVTDRGAYHAKSAAWNAKDAVASALKSIDVQLERRSGRRYVWFFFTVFFFVV